MPADPEQPTAAPETATPTPEAPVHRAAPATAAERREAALSFGDIQSRVTEAIVGTFKGSDDDWFDLWVQDLGTDWVVFQSWEANPGVGLWQLSYSLDADGYVTFGGDPVKVDEVTSYVPVEAPAQASGPAEAKAATDPAETRGSDEAAAAAVEVSGRATGSQTVAGKARSKAKKPRHRAGLPVGREYRRFSAKPEVRSVTDANGNEQIVVTGQPIVYDTPYSVWDMFGEFSETVHAGSVTSLLADGSGLDCRFLFNHDGLPLARLGGPASSTTLTLTDSAEALTCSASLDARQQLANDLAVAIERGDVNQMSIGFCVAPAGDAWSDDYCTRDIWAIEDLLDVSAVTYPASPTTSIEVAQRMAMEMPVESRTRVRKLWTITRDLTRATSELREGKVLSSANAQTLATGAAALQNALALLHGADDADIPGIVQQLEDLDQALDAGQGAISTVLGVANPDGDAGDENPELVPADEPGGDDPDAGEETDSDSEPVEADETPDGSDGGAADGGPDNQDGTGQRSTDDPLAEARAEAELLKIRAEHAALRRAAADAKVRREALSAECPDAQAA